MGIGFFDTYRPDSLGLPSLESPMLTTCNRAACTKSRWGGGSSYRAPHSGDFALPTFSERIYKGG